jgi:hypothetical protein
MSRTRIILLALLALVAGAALAAEPPLSLSPLRAVYERTEPVDLVVTNTAAADIRFYSNLEMVNVNSEWVTWPYRIEDARAGVVANVYLLHPGQSQTIHFDITHIPQPRARPVDEPPKRMPSRMKLRFRVVALAGTSDDVLGETKTEPFYVKHPYK